LFFDKVVVGLIVKKVPLMLFLAKMILLMLLMIKQLLLANCWSETVEDLEVVTLIIGLKMF